ncbi:AbiH family protein [Cytophagales bacterium LB-30]|uniref:AbiH family protein n=1 Tax=Shiella aurantiaca TaxID=3058365 RepID=A0ABT8F821_9BACT|nr:AbiH family protein [Shiella aurantiaca]MDN4166577.1 AbiH family protein [Shiella aurantiaca]
MNNLLSLPSPEVNGLFPDEYDKVNRLIIIGNGFDLAHGLKTSFKDFINDYLFEVLRKIKSRKNYEDSLISFQTYYPVSILRDLDNYPREKIVEFFQRLRTNERDSFVKYSSLLSDILSEVNQKKWVDIELRFFKMLKDYRNDEESVKIINQDMDFLKEKLKEYLIKVCKGHKLELIPEIKSQFKQVLKKKEAQPNTIKSDMKVASTCVLNFNYTSTPEEYMKGLKISNHIQIHGSLNGDNISSQGLVFGFGDELDDDYLKFEKQENDDIFEHIKSFKYLHFQNYRNLLDFIESDPFQVHVYGHSLGLSDRTLLNTIFENRNCISIKLFYHKTDNGDDFERKTYAISRHFRSKEALRSKVVNKELSEPMGQLMQKNNP